ncbi:MAG: PAS domain S-box protein [Acidobacteriota bacterium]
MPDRASLDHDGRNSQGKGASSASLYLTTWGAVMMGGLLGAAVCLRLEYHILRSFLATGIEVALGIALAWSLWRLRPTPSAAAESAGDYLEIFDSAGPMMLTIGLDGRIAQANPAAQRMLGYYAEELVMQPDAATILAPGEGPRIFGELQRLNGMEPEPPRERDRQWCAVTEIVGRMTPSHIPSFEAQFQRKDGTPLPCTVQLSAVRDGRGALRGLLIVALDASNTMRQEQASRESQERYRDLFENSSEMIATLSPTGQFLYANPAWKQCFGLNHSALLDLNSFEDVFGPDCRSEVGALFRRALEGEMIDRAPLRNHTPDGRVLEFELSLSQRQRAGSPLAIRCLLRDVTQQKQREHRLALQLVVSQIVGENTSAELAATRILEALCISQGWDLAFKWEVNQDDQRLEFCTGWASPGQSADGLMQESAGRVLADEHDLPVRVWRTGKPIWMADLPAAEPAGRARTALRHSMVSGWAAPVRVGNRVIAVLEFYSHLRLRESHEAQAAIETVAASLGQMLARTRERGRAEELSRQQEILLNSVADGICGIDRRGVVMFANPAAARMLGAATTQLNGMAIHNVLHGAGTADAQTCGEECPLRRAAERQVASSAEDTFYRADGSSFPVEYFFTPILEQGRFSGSVLSFRDISQRYALDRLKDEFISTVSHELRTPLTSIRGALGLLSSGILGQINDKAANLLRIATTNSDRLVRLINDILDLERIQGGREPITFRSLQLSDVIRQAIDGMQPVADAAGVQLLHDTTPAEISGDPDRLLQVLTNLLSNAVKFSPQGATVSVVTRPGVSGVTLSVIDQGRGIPADKLEAIFGRFQQVDASDSRQKGGSGLGLAICRSIVNQHSGRVWAERNPVRGSTFRVYLPYKPTPTTVTPNELLEQGTVLLADSNRATRPLLVEKLARHGYRVVESVTVDQTVAAARENVQAILLDTALDGMNGFEVLPLLRKMDPEHQVPIVLLSMSDQSTAELPVQSDGVVHKPVQEDALLNELARVLCGPGERARILIVEDDRDLAHIIADVFSRDAIEVRVAHTRQAALDECFKFQPQLVVLDIGLPDGDGFNVVDWLRQQDHLANLPLVVYSGRDLDPRERRSLTLGPTHFLTKTRVQPQQLEALILTLLRNSRQMEEVSPIASADRSR